MPAIRRHREFASDLSKQRFSDSQFDRFVRYLSLLQQGSPLPKEALDHPLKGSWKGHREFHIGGDLLIIYRPLVDEDAIQLFRIGTHSELFE